MTSALSASASLSSVVESESRVSKAKKPSKQEVLLEMAETMVREGGLLNAQQAAIFLEISRERVYELMELGMLTKYEFLGRTYMSFKEIQTRRQADLKAGRPKRGLLRRIALGVKEIANTDVEQLYHHGVSIADKQLERDVERRKKRLKK